MPLTDQEINALVDLHVFGIIPKPHTFNVPSNYIGDWNKTMLIFKKVNDSFTDSQKLIFMQTLFGEAEPISLWAMLQGVSRVKKCAVCMAALYALNVMPREVEK